MLSLTPVEQPKANDPGMGAFIAHSTTVHLIYEHLIIAGAVRAAKTKLRIARTVPVFSHCHGH